MRLGLQSALLRKYPVNGLALKMAEDICSVNKQPLKGVDPGSIATRPRLTCGEREVDTWGPSATSNRPAK
jgi:hypothetical protein